MRSIRRILVVSAGLFLISTQVMSAEIVSQKEGDKTPDAIEDQDKEKDKKKKEKKKDGVIPVALPFYGPETSGGIGWSILYYHNDDPKDEKRRPDELALYGAATLNKQFSVGISSDVYFQKELLRLTGRVDGSRFPDMFWGIGPKTKKYMKEPFTSTTINVQPAFMVRIFKNFYAGPAYQYIFDHMNKRKRNKALILDFIAGSDGTEISGPGLKILWDTRDNVFFPAKGFYAEIRLMAYRKEFKSEYNFSRMEIDLRWYQRIYGDHVFGLQGIMRLHKGKVPFQAMPKLGGDMMLRGFYEGRFRDSQYVALQGEYRFPIAWRFAGTVFGAVGQMGPTLKEMKINHKDIKASWGLGLRFIADKTEHVTVRLDMGFNNETNFKAFDNVYLQIKEAF